MDCDVADLHKFPNTVTVKLQTLDRVQPIEVDIDIANQLRIVGNMIEDLGIRDEPIILPNVSSDILKIVIEFCDQYKGNKDVLLRAASPVVTLEMDDWGVSFMKRHINDLFGVILAADYLEVMALLDLCCKFIVDQVRGMKPKAIREFFRIESDWSPEEALQIMKENGWKEGEF
ncbi:SCF ubiquitin ligase [Schizopora paradoxa]|uniref:E3 ubiquitin ligase complex SCF subunit n=1 Tax=Schizopora paradoxa TaxID=27342 RepID=A0A0H2QXD4_9AGAM|nr:SCF ubiquitin ligase [Schizopora paradoxa]